MLAPSAASVFTGNQGGQGDNTGGAAVLQTNPAFLPYAMQMATLRRQEQKQQAIDKKQEEKDWQGLMKSFNPDEVQLRDQEEIMKGLQEYNQGLADMHGKGLKPSDYYGEGGKFAREKEFALRNKAKASGENAAFRAKLVDTISKDDTGDYNKAHAANWLKEYDKLPIEKQAEYRLNNNPFVRNFSYGEVLDEVVPTAFEKSIEQGSKTTTVSGMNQEGMRAAMEQHLTTPRGQEQFQRWESNHPDQTEEDYIEDIVKRADATFKKTEKVSYDEPRAVSSSGGSGSKSKGLTPTPSHDSQGNVNGATMNYEDQNPKTVQLKDGNGNYDNYVIVGVKPDADGSHYMYAKKKSSLTKEDREYAESQIKPEQLPYTAAQIAEVSGSDNNATKLEYSKRVAANKAAKEEIVQEMMGNKTVKLPFDGTVGSLGEHNYNKWRDETGMTYEEFMRKNKVGGGAAPQDGKKKETPAERAARIANGG